MRTTNFVLAAAAAAVIGGWTVGGRAATQGPSTEVAAVGDLASLREGIFTTQPASSESTGVAPSAAILVDLAKRVDVPALGNAVVYDELREGGQDGKIVRQTLYAFKLNDVGAIQMTAYGFANARDVAGAYANAAPLAKLNPSDLKPQSPGCDVVWRKAEDGFAGDFQTGCANAPRGTGSAKPEPVMTVSKAALQEPIEGGAPKTFRRIR